MQVIRKILCLAVAVTLLMTMGLWAFAADTAPTDQSPAPTQPPTQPTQPPTQPTEPPTQPTEPPTQPTEPPTLPTAPTGPSPDPTQPTEPTASSEPSPDPSNPDPQPTEPGSDTTAPTAPTTRPWVAPTTRPTWRPTPTQPPAPVGTWPWDSNDAVASVVHTKDADAVSVPDDTNIEQRDADGNLFYTIPYDWTAQDVINWFVLNYSLTPESFAVSFRCPGTGDAAGYNQDSFFLAANTYMLPLNLYYFEEEAAGKLSATTRIGTETLTTAREKSILDSDNEVSQEMIRRFGTYKAFKEEMLKRYGDLDTDTVPETYYENNYYTTRFMCNTLSYLYTHQEDFPDLLALMKQTMPDRYLRHYAGTTEIAHKHGTFQGFYHDVGIVYTAEPYLLAVFTNNVIGRAAGEELVGRVCLALTAWQNRPTEPPEESTADSETEPPTEPETAAPTTVPATTQAESATPTETAAAPVDPEAKTGGTPWYFVAFPVAILIGAIATVIVFSKKR